MEKNDRFIPLYYELLDLLQELDQMEKPGPIKDATQKLEDLLFAASFPHNYFAGDLYLPKKQRKARVRDLSTPPS
jgi:hypothetical protein